MENSRAIDGNDVINIIQEQTISLIERGIHPKVIHIDSYSYYLLKDMLQRTQQKTTCGYIEIYEFEIVEYKLKILIDAETLKEGQPKDHPEIIKVYGE